MKINFKKVMLAGTAIVALGAITAPGQAYAQCATTGNIAADCTMVDPATTGAITLNSGVDLTFTSAGQTFTVNHTIDGAAANAGTLNSGGSGSNILFQSSVGSFGSANTLAGATIGSGDIWYLSGDVGATVGSGSDIFLESGGTFTINGGTLNFVSSGSTVGGFGSAKNISFSGGSSADTITFSSSGDNSGTQNIIYASVFDLGGGNDVINFASGNGNIDVRSFTTGAGDDSITFNSGSIKSEGVVDLGTGNDTITFSSVVDATAASMITGTGLTAGTGNDTIVFNSGGAINVGTGTVDMGSGNDTVTFKSGGMITASNVDGGAGTDTISFLSSGDVTIGYDVSNFETANIGAGTDLKFASAGFSGSTAVMMYTSSSLAFTGGTTETISGSITGDGGSQIIYLSNGGATVSSTISLGGGDDTLVYSSGSLTGTVDFGAGTGDTLVVGNNTTAGTNIAITAAMSNVENVHQAAGSTVTLSAAITGVDDADNDGWDVNGGTLVLESGASIDGAINSIGGSGTGNLKFGSSGNGGTFNLGGIVEDVNLFISSGTLNTNGFAMGANSALGKVYVSAGTLKAYDNITTTRFTNSGNVTIDHDNIITSTNTVDGGGTYTFLYFSSAGEETIGGITSGANIDFSSATLVFSVAPGSGVVRTGTGVIAYASAGGAVTASTSVSDTSFLYNFTPQVATPGVLDVSQSVSLAEATTTSNNLAVATVLLTDPDLVTTTDPTLQALQAAVSGATTQEEFNDALEQAQPTVDGSGVVTALNVANNTFNVMSDRLAMLRTGDEVSGMTTGNVTQGLRGWTQAFAATGNQDRRDSIDGYDFDSYGVAVGLDTENIGDDTVLGVAFSYANTDADSDNASRTNTDTDSYQFTIYGSHDFADNIYMNGMAAYARNSVETDRLVANATAHGDYDADQFTLRAEVGRDYEYEGMTLSPHVMGHWTHYNADSYSETGAGGAGQRIDMDTVNIAELGVGVKGSWLYRNADGSYFTPELKLDYRYDFAGDEVEMTSQFLAGGAAFSTKGFDAQQSTVDAGVGFTYFTTDNWELSAEYNYEWKEDFDAHSGMARAAYRF